MMRSPIENTNKLRTNLCCDLSVQKLHKRFVGKGKIPSSGREVANIGRALTNQPPNIPQSPAVPRSSNIIHSSQSHALNQPKTFPAPVDPKVHGDPLTTKTTQASFKSLEGYRKRVELRANSTASKESSTDVIPVQEASSATEEPVPSTSVSFDPVPSTPSPLPSQLDSHPETPVYKPLSVIELLRALEQKGLITYGATGKYGCNGEAKLTKQGHELHRHMNRPKFFLKKKDSKSEILEKDELNSEKQAEIIGGTLKIAESTVVARPEQGHVIAVKEVDGTYTGIAMLTSQKGIKIGLDGVAGPENQKLSDVNYDGQQKAQYAVLLSPPLKIDLADFTEVDEITTYMQNQVIQGKLKAMALIADKYKTMPYKSKGLDESNLEDLNNFYDEIYHNSAESSSPKNTSHISDDSSNEVD